MYTFNRSCVRFLLCVLALYKFQQLNAQTYCASGNTATYHSHGQFAMDITDFTLQGEQYSIIGITNDWNDLGVQDFTQTDSASLAQGGNYSFSIETYFIGSAYPQYPAHTIGMWIDFNNDGDFTDAGEEITNTAISYPSNPVNVNNFSFTVPVTSSLGKTRLRVSAKARNNNGNGTAGAPPTLWPCGTFGYGATYDFTVNIVAPNSPCHSNSTPYHNGFEGFIGNNIYPHLPNCWDTISTNTNNGYWTPASNVYDPYKAYNGNNSLHIRGSLGDNGFHGVVSPKIQDLHINKEVYLFCRGYNMCSSSSNPNINDNQLIVGTIDSNLSTSSIQYVDTIFPTSSYSDYLIELNGLNATAHRLVLMAPLNGNSCNSSYVDNILIDSKSSCPPPDNVNLSVLSDSTLLVTLTGSALDNGAIISWLKSDSLGLTITDSTSNDSLFVTNLEPGTNYDFYVQRNCNDSLGAYSLRRGPYKIQTPCESTVSPWYDDDLQNNYASLSPSGGIIYLPDCWAYDSNGGDSYISKDTWSSYLFARNFANGNDTTAITSPWIENLADEKQILTFYARTTNTNSLGKFDIISTDLTGSYKAANFIDQFTLYGATTFQKFTVYLDSTNIRLFDKRIGFRFYSNSTTNTEYLYIDSVYLKPTCPDRLPLPIALSSDTTFCFGDSVELSAPNTSYFNYPNENDSFKSYMWSNGATGQSIKVYNTDTIVLSVETQRGCILQSDPIHIKVNPLPIAGISLSDSVACYGDSIELNVTGSVGIHQWSNSVIDSITHVYQIGNSTLSYFTTDQNGCIDTSESITVEIYPTPSATISATTLNPCLGDTLLLSSPNANNVNYLWSNGDTLSSISVFQSANLNVTATNIYGCSSVDSANIVFHNYPTSEISTNGDTIACDGETVTLFGPSGNYNYEWSNGDTNSYINLTDDDTVFLALSNSYGCLDTSATQIVIFNDSPSLTISMAGPSQLCYGDSILLYPTSTINVDSISWHSLNGAQIQRLGDTLIITETDQYHAIAYNSLGCIDTTQIYSFTFNTKADTSVSVSGMLNFCDGDSVTITASAGQQYVWSTGDTTQSITTNVAGTYYAVVTTPFGCSDTTATYTTTLLPNPDTSVAISGSLDFCPTDSVTLTAQAGLDYLWNNGDTNQSIIVSLSGSYFATITNSLGCSATTATYTTNVLSAPDTLVTTSGSLNLCSGQSVTLTAAPGYTYLWNTGATNQSITTNSSGVYYAIVTTNDGCIDTTNSNVVTVSSIPTPTINASQLKLCSGQMATLSTPNTYSSYVWGGDTIGTLDSITVNAGHYWLTVTNSSGCSGSDTIQIDEIVPYTTQPEICIVTNDSATGFNKIIWERNSKLGVEYYNIYRDDVIGYTKVGSKGVNQLSQLLDNTANPGLRSYKYYLTITDSCGIEHGSAVTEHSTIHLQSNLGTNGEVNLLWNSYTGRTPLYYRIYRKASSASIFTVIDSVNLTSNTYTDFNTITGFTTYQVAAVMGSGCNSSNKTGVTTSLSNSSTQNTISINENAFKSVKILPNPNRGVFSVSFSQETVRATYTIINSTGQIISNGVIKNKHHPIDLSNQPKGVYMIRISIGNIIESFKVIVQ